MRFAALAPVFTASFSVLPGLNVGAVEAAIATLSPVRGLRPVRAGHALVPKAGYSLYGLSP